MNVSAIRLKTLGKTTTDSSNPVAMKRYSKILMSICAIAMASCTAEKLEEANPQVGEGLNLKVEASLTKTRSVFGDKSDNAYSSLWTSSKDVQFSLDGASFVSATPAITDGGKGATFNVRFTTSAASSGVVLAFSPKGDASSTPKLGGFASMASNYASLVIPATQKPTEKTCDESVHLLYGYAEYEGSATSSLDMAFHHAAAYGKMRIDNFEGGDIESVSVTFPTAVAGESCKFWYMAADGNEAATVTGADLSTITLVTEGLSTNEFWFGCAPCADMTSGNMVVKVVGSDGYEYVKTVSLSSSKKIGFKQGRVSAFTVDMSGVQGIERWTLVTDHTTLAAGDVLVIACQGKGATAGTKSSDYLKQVSSTFSADASEIATLGEGTLQFTLGGRSGAWTLTTADGDLLGCTAQGKMTLGYSSAVNEWTISIANDATATIAVAGKESTYGHIMYNVSSPRFNTYKSAASTSMMLPQLYRRGTPGSTITKAERNLAFSSSTVSAALGADFNAPTLSGSTSGVTYSSSNENVATVADDGTVTLIGVGSATITASAPEDDDYYSGSASYSLSVGYLFRKASKVTSGKQYLIVANNGAFTLLSGKTYGYPNLTSVTIDGDEIVMTSLGCAFTFTSKDSGYTILSNDGKYVYQTGTYNSFNWAETAPEGDVWTVSIASDGKATITNVLKSKTIQYASNYTSFGSYSSVTNTLPVLYELVGSESGGGSGSGGDSGDTKVTTVTTGAATSITTSTATLNGSFANASASPREAGFEWGLTSSLGETQQCSASPAGTSGSFNASIDNLTAGRTYYYRAYIIVSENGTNNYYYGSVKSFTVKSESTSTDGYPTWYELPVMNVSKSGSYLVNSKDNTQYYAYHLCAGNEKSPSGSTARNYTVCYSSEHHCPLWVAAPRHSMYVGNSGRNDSYTRDGDIPASIQYSSKSTGGGCNKGHMLGSAERTSSTATNKQVFYYPNIAPQLSSGFNTGGGGWNLLEDYVDTQVCADTLYEVVGCYFDTYKDGYGYTVSPKTISFGGRSDVDMPTMFYYVLLRTKNGSSKKSVVNCTADELKCVAFVRAHTNSLKGQKPSSAELMSVSDLEKITGVTYFPHVPNAPKNTFSASDWGL